MSLPIIFHDEHLIAINKPSGLLVHRSMIDRHETRFAMQMVRDQIGQHVYPVHRLDKPTSGVLLFAKSSEIAALLGKQFEAQQVHKTYQAVVRGWAPERGVIDHALKEKHDKISDKKASKDKPAQPALTRYKRLAKSEMPFAVERYPQTRYSWVELYPETGRKHQLRRHMKHIAHPIIGDAKHGKGEHNRYIAEHFGVSRLLLACTQMTLHHPISNEPLTLNASLDEAFHHALQVLNLATPTPE